MSDRFNEVCSAYAMAIRANMQDSCRNGELIELPAKGDVVVMGDLHGNIGNFEKTLAAVDLDANKDRHLIVQEPTHTYEVTEDHSYLLVEKIVEAKVRFPDQIHVILGNHELSELTGKEILKGGICYNILFREGMKQEYGRNYPAVQDLFHSFIKTMPLACLAPNKIFISHSTPAKKYIPHYSLKFFRNGTGDEKKDRLLTEKLVWGRDLTQEAADAFAAQVQSEILVVGHTACKRGYMAPNTRHIILDSKGTFATTMHFRLNRTYAHSDLLKKNIQHINKKAVKEAISRKREKKPQ